MLHLSSKTLFGVAVSIISIGSLTNSCSKADKSIKPKPVMEEIQMITPISGYVSSDSYVSIGYVGKPAYIDNDTIDIYISATANIKKARLGMFNAAGTLVDYVYCDSIKPQSITTSRPYEQGYGYKYKVRYKPATKLQSGVYRISKKIPVVIKNSTPANKVLIVYPTNTENAYNAKGGASMYTSPSTYIASFLRPTTLHRFSTEFIKWNATSYPFDYVTDMDLENYANMGNYKLMVVIGHSEYWTRKARMNFDRFVNEGKHVLLLTGNTMWWQVRYSADSTQMICYKNATRDPITDPLLKTITWVTTTLQYPVIPSIGADFSKGGYGMLPDSGWNGYKILVPTSPLLTGTNLKKYDTISCATHEFDGTYVIRYPNQDPVLDRAKFNAYRVEMIAYDLGKRYNSSTTANVHPFLIYQRTQTSGIIVNTSSTNWCHPFGFAGTTGPAIKLITKNAIELLMADRPVFSTTVP